MNREEIIELAREAGAMADHMTWVERDLLPVFERFAALVAAAEREKVAKEWEQWHGFDKHTVAAFIRARGETK
jgi:hypothetical protein